MQGSAPLHSSPKSHAGESAGYIPRNRTAEWELARQNKRRAGQKEGGFLQKQWCPRRQAAARKAHTAEMARDPVMLKNAHAIRIRT